MKVSLQIAEEIDLEELKQLINVGDEHHRINIPSIFKKTKNKELIYSYYENIIKKGNLFVAKYEEKIVGFLSTYYKETSDFPIFVKKRYAMIDNVVILEKFRNFGVGIKLMLYAENEIKKQNIDEVCLNVYSFNKSAKSLYEKLGYLLIEEKMVKNLQIKKITDSNALSKDYSYKIITREEFTNFFNKNRSKIFTDCIDCNIRELLSDKETKKLNELAQFGNNSYSLYISIFYKNNQIGWLYGKQENFETFYMTNAGIFTEHQNKGIYTKLLPKVLDILKEKGFQIVHSRHNASNNQIIIPKLKQGFMITGMEISDQFGTLIHLSYYCNNNRKSFIKFRTGEKKLNKDIKKHVNL